MIMNKFPLLLILPFLSLVMAGCDDDKDDVIAPDLSLFAGNWEVVDQGNQKVFARNCILDIKSGQIHEGYGGYQGYITTYFLSASGTLRHDRVFSFSIREVEKYKPLLDVEFLGELDGNDQSDSYDLWDGNYSYNGLSC